VVPAAGQRLADPERRSARLRLIGQNFTAPGYFQGRPSATAEMPDNPMASGGSNLAASNPALDKAVSERVQPCAPPTRTPARGSGGAGDRLGERAG
jgi:K+-transporting ATPase c subunit